MSLQKSRRIFGEKKKKNQVKKSRGVFVETYAVAPAPSRDYYALQLFQKKFVLTKWRICHGPFAAPTQTTVLLENYKKNATLQNELTYIFGVDVTNLLSDLANENWSLTSMPSNILQKIFSYISVPDILRLSQVCKRLNKVIKSVYEMKSMRIAFCQVKGMKKNAITPLKLPNLLEILGKIQYVNKKPIIQECSSNDLWKTICKKQWKILIHNDTEKASLIGWKTVYLEKMRPKRYELEPGHQGHSRVHLRSRPMSQLSRIQSASTLNTPDHRGSVKSNLTIPKRGIESKKFDANRSTSEIFGKDFKVMSASTGKSTDRTYTVARVKASSREIRPTTGDKLILTPRKYFPQSSSSNLNLSNALHVGSSARQKPSARATTALPKSTATAAAPPVVSKVTSIRVRPQMTTPSAQSATDFIGGNNKLQGDRAKSKTGKAFTKKQ